MEPILHLENINKSYYLGKQELQVLKGISLNIFKNEYVALMGPSGSGKSTLMNILGCLDTPTSGTYILNGQDVSKMPDNDLATIRNKEIGLCFSNLIYYQGLLLQKMLLFRWCIMATQGSSVWSKLLKCLRELDLLKEAIINQMSFQEDKGRE